MLSTKGLFRKTKLCKFFSEGRCRLMEACSFAHGQQDLVATPEFPCRKLCKKFVGTGSCEKGASCVFAHCSEEEDVRARRAAAGNSYLQPGQPAPPRESASHVAETRGDEAVVMAVQFPQTQVRQQLVLAFCCAPVLVPGPPDAGGRSAGYASELLSPGGGRWQACGGPKSGAPEAGEIGSDVAGMPCCGECEDPFEQSDGVSRQSTDEDVILSHADSSNWSSEQNPGDGELEDVPEQTSLPRMARALGLACRERKTFLDFANLEPDDDGLPRPLRRVRSTGDCLAAMSLSQ